MVFTRLFLSENCRVVTIEIRGDTYRDGILQRELTEKSRLYKKYVIYYDIQNGELFTVEL